MFVPRRSRRDAFRRAKWYDLGLESRLRAALNRRQSLFVSGFVRAENAAYDAIFQRRDAILECASQQRIGVELDVFIGLTIEAKGLIESLLDVVQTKTKTAGYPLRH